MLIKMNFANNKKKKISLVPTGYIMRKRENTNTGCEMSLLIKLTANIINFYKNLERMIVNFTRSELLLLLPVEVLLFFLHLYQRTTFFNYLIVYDCFLEERSNLKRLKELNLNSAFM